MVALGAATVLWMTRAVTDSAARPTSSTSSSVDLVFGDAVSLGGFVQVTTG